MVGQQPVLFALVWVCTIIHLMAFDHQDDATLVAATAAYAVHAVVFGRGWFKGDCTAGWRQLYCMVVWWAPAQSASILWQGPSNCWVRKLSGFCLCCKWMAVGYYYVGYTDCGGDLALCAQHHKQNSVTAVCVVGGIQLFTCFTDAVDFRVGLWFCLVGIRIGGGY